MREPDPRLSHEPTERAEQGGEGDETLRVEQGEVWGKIREQTRASQGEWSRAVKAKRTTLLYIAQIDQGIAKRFLVWYPKNRSKSTIEQHTHNYTKVKFLYDLQNWAEKEAQSNRRPYKI